MAIKTRAFDAASLLKDEEDIRGFLALAFESNDAAHIADALGVAARARGMTAVAKDAGLSRESLYRALSDSGNPEFETVMKVVGALGLRLTVAA